MSTKTVHILNGDALAGFFPKALKGEQLIMRECMIEGPLSTTIDESFFSQREKYLRRTFGESVEVNYELMVKSRLNQLLTYEPEVSFNCWFEEDLFCQANFWFLVYFLQKNQKTNPIFIVRPKPETPFSFAHCSKEELMKAFQRKLEIKDIKAFSELYQYYATNQDEKLLSRAKNLKVDYPFILPAVEAHLARNLNSKKPGKPERILTRLIKENNTTALHVIFPLFQKEATIYGFGDLQVEHMIARIKIV